MMTEIGEHEQVRREKLEKLRALGVEPYGVKHASTHQAAQVIENFAALEGQTVALTGRLMTIRAHGKASFAHLQDESGQIQIYVRLNDVGEKAYEVFSLLDIGDIVGVTGEVFRTRRGEETIAVKELRLLAKTLEAYAGKMAWSY